MLSTTTWAAGFLLRKGQSREALGKWLTNTRITAVEEKKKNLASHNRNVSVWKVAIQDQLRKRPTLS